MMKNKISSFQRDQWKMLFITMFCYLFFYTGRHNFGWAAKEMASSLHLSFEQIGWISFSMLISYAIGQFINGNLADRMDPRMLITLGGILSVIANYLISFTNQYLFILLLWAANGYFQSMAWAAGSRLISNWWEKERHGMAFGFYTMAAGCSSVLTYVLSIILVERGLGWRALFRYPVLLLLGAVLLFYLIARGKPSDKGYPTLSSVPQKNTAPDWWQRYRTVLTHRPFLFACLSIGFQSMARYGLIFWVPVYFLGKDYEHQNQSVWLTLLMPIGMAAGALSFGYISDRIFQSNRPASIRMGMLVSAAIAFLIYFTPAGSPWLVAALMFLSGFFVYGPQANFWPMSSELLGAEYIGTGVGVMNMAAYLFAALGEPLLGKIMDITHQTALIFPVIAFISLSCAITISLVKKTTKQIAVAKDDQQDTFNHKTTIQHDTRH